MNINFSKAIFMTVNSMKQYYTLFMFDVLCFSWQFGAIFCIFLLCTIDIVYARFLKKFFFIFYEYCTRRHLFSLLKIVLLQELLTLIMAVGITLIEKRLIAHVT